MSKPEEKSRGRLIIQIVVSIILIAGVAALCVYLFPLVLRLREPDARAAFMEEIRSLGARGYVVMILLQIAQVVIAFIPGEPIELIMGLLYGTWGGFFTCLAGIAIGTLIIFWGVSKFGERFVDKFISSKGFEKLKFLHNPKRRDILVFILFFIPGTPKDLLTYFAPFTKMNTWRFLLLSTVARIPSVLSSTYVGSNIGEGRLLHSAIVFAVVGVISLIGILIYNRIIQKENAAEITPAEQSDDKDTNADTK